MKNIDQLIVSTFFVAILGCEADKKFNRSPSSSANTPQGKTFSSYTPDEYIELQTEYEAVVYEFWRQGRDRMIKGDQEFSAKWGNCSAFFQKTKNIDMDVYRVEGSIKGIIRLKKTNKSEVEEAIFHPYRLGDSPMGTQIVLVQKD